MNETESRTGAEGAGAPSEEELRAALEEQMSKITVKDVLLQTAVTLVNLAARRLGVAGGEDAAAERDLDQAQLAIDAVRALAPLLEGEEAAPIKGALSQLQLAFAQAAGGAAPPGAAAGTEKPESEPNQPEQEPSRIWTPPGA